MKTTFYLIFSFISFIVITSCNTHKDLTEDELYTILNGIIEDDSLRFDTLCYQFNSFENPVKYENEFSSEDIKFINKQNESFKNYQIKPNKLKKYNWKKNKSSPYIVLDAKCDLGNSFISFPLISSDRKMVILGYSGGWGVLSGSGQKVLYIFENGHWKNKGILEYVHS